MGNMKSKIKLADGGEFINFRASKVFNIFAHICAEDEIKKRKAKEKNEQNKMDNKRCQL